MNVIDLDMVKSMLSSLDYWRKTTSPKVVILAPGKGHRAFSAGGDMKGFYNLMKGPNPNLAGLDDLNFQDYSLHLGMALTDFFKVAIWDGIVMGAGVGVSVHS